MNDDVSVMVFLAAAGGNANIIQYLLSSHGDLIDINIQDKVDYFIISCFLFLIILLGSTNPIIRSCKSGQLSLCQVATGKP